MKWFGKSDLRISVKVAISFIILVLLQGIVSFIALSTIIGTTQRHSFESQMKRTVSGIEGYLDETLKGLKVNAELIAGQKKVIDYTDFGLRNLLHRELTVFTSSLPVDSISIYSKPDQLFTSEGVILAMNTGLSTNVEKAFQGRSFSFLHTQGNNIWLTLLSPVKREETVIGVIGLNILIDSGFLEKVEHITDSLIMFLLDDIAVDTGTIDKDLREMLIEQVSLQPAGFKPTWIPGFFIDTADMSILGTTDGFILCLLNTEEIHLLINRSRTISLISTFIILTVALAIAFVFYRVTFLRPFQAIIEGVHRISEGDLKYHFNVTTKDEFKELADAFHTMSENLQRREKEISQLSRYNFLILQNVRSGIISIDLQNVVVTINPAAGGILGLSGSDLTGKRLDEIPFPREIRLVIEESKKQKEHLTRREITTGTGGTGKVLSVSTSPLLSEDDRPMGTIIIFADITTVKKLEEELLISSRLAALGEMAAGVAHQIRNPLGVMKVSAEMLRDDFHSTQQPENYNKITAMIVNEIDTLNHVVSNFLDFARPRDLKLNYQSIPEILELSKGCIPLYQFPDISIETSLAPELPERMMDKSMMVQVISNLLLNAIEASNRGDVVFLKCFPFKEGIAIEIEDSGHGFDEEIRKQIFNPFFTTKPHGTGLGLSIVHRIIEQHHGVIEAESIPGKGSLFRIIL